MKGVVAGLALAPTLLALATASVGASAPKSELRPDFRRASCGTPFEIDALRGPTGAERGSEPWAVALRRLFRTAPQYIFGERGPWRLLLRTKRTVVFGSRNLPRIAVAELEKSRGGRWNYAGSGSGCLPVVVRAGLEASPWRFDPRFPAPAPTDSVFHLLVTEQDCASGDSAAGRILEPTIYSRPRAVTVTYFVEPRPGVQTCPSNPPTPVTLELPEPLGDKQLFDGQKVLRKQRLP